jgi:prepilin-type N-terminal cleavage/methylation domain-containing protein
MSKKGFIISAFSLMNIRFQTIRCRAFTMAELLVTLAIIAILISIAVPVYRSLVEKSRVTADLSNLRQLGLATRAFTNDHGYIMGAPWPTSLNPAYLPDWRPFKSPFDKRPASDKPETAPVSYDLNGHLWGLRPVQIASSSNCILFSPLLADPERLQFMSTAWLPSTPAPLSIGSCGEMAKGGTHLGGSEINVIYCDLHAASIPMTDFHSPLPNPEEASPISDLRWNR